MITALIVVFAAAAVLDRFTKCAGGWVWFAFVQVVMGIAALVGLVALIYPCHTQAWVHDAKSIKDGRTIDRWRWKPLNFVFGNPEDGVSGQCARIWNETGTAEEPYLPQASAAWRAYRWSALRNSADGLKYVFAWDQGPSTTILKRKVGWFEENGIRVPIL